MTRRPLLILLEFVLITGPLTWWWLHGGLDFYYGIFQRLGFPILGEMGVNTFNPGLVRDRMINFIPFIGLMLVTPGLGFRRRFVGLGVGMVLIFFSHVLLAYWAWASFERDGQVTASMAQFFPGLLMADAVPFVIWAVIANRVLADLISNIVSRKPASNAPEED